MSNHPGSQTKLVLSDMIDLFERVTSHLFINSAYKHKLHQRQLCSTTIIWCFDDCCIILHLTLLSSSSVSWETSHCNNFLC